MIKEECMVSCHRIKMVSSGKQDSEHLPNFMFFNPRSSEEVMCKPVHFFARIFLS